MDASSPQPLRSEQFGARRRLTLNRPAQRNALDAATLDALRDAFAEIDADPGIRVVTITGAGQAFCSGADLKAVAGQGETAILRFIDSAAEVFDAVRRCRCPVIAALNGLTLAGGLELALACDIIVAADEAMIGDGHANFGMFPGAGGAALLPGRIGYHAAMHLLATGGMLPAARWVALGLVQECVPGERLPDLLDTLEGTIADKSASALAAIKRVARLGFAEREAKTLAAERAALAVHAQSPDFAEGLAAFAERRVPRFNGELA